MYILSMWFVLAMLYLTDELFTRVNRFLTNRLHGKAAEHS